MEFSRTLATVWILLAVTQFPVPGNAGASNGVVDGKPRYLSYRRLDVTPHLPSPDADEDDVTMPGQHLPHLSHLKNHWRLSHHHHNHHSHHHRGNQPYYHRHHYQNWMLTDDGGGGVTGGTEDGEHGKRTDAYGEKVPGGLFFSPSSYASSSSSSSLHQHHSNKHHRSKQMKRRSTGGEEGGYAFRVDERNGVRRVIAVRGGARRESGATGDVDAAEDARFQDFAQHDATMGPPPGPSFDRNLPRNITIQKGKTAVLSCRVFNVNDKSVSWIRQDNLHILTVDKYKYSTDQRVSVLFNEPNLEWVLRIKSVNPADAGTYECQVSTKPILSFVVNMRVVVPRAWILNAPEIYVHRGSPINLTCVVTHGTEKPVFIYWYHHDKVIDYEGRGGVTVHTQTGRDTVSHLLVEDAGPRDNGRYTCSPSNGEPASVMLHVLNGEHQAAMQTNRGAVLRGRGVLWAVLATLLQALHHLVSVRS